MVGKSFCIVVTGLPASGKTTIGAKIAVKLGLPFLDKDDYLEVLFDQKGTGDPGWRQDLSRESDALFQQDAVNNSAAVLVSHWRPGGKNLVSGTPTEWLGNHFSKVIELYCACPVEVAAKRFMNRKRHPGHLDGQRIPEETFARLLDYQQYLPLSLGAIERVETDSELPLDGVIERLGKYAPVDAYLREQV